METNRKWYAVYTKPRWEKKVATLLTKKKLENYCPLNKVIRQWSDRRKTLLEPLFTSYVFVYLSADEIVLARRTEGVRDFVYWQARLAIIKDEEIDAIRNFLDEYQSIQLEKINVNVNDEVRIEKGPLAMLQGIVTEIKSRSIKLYLPTLGYLMTAEVDKSNVSIVGRNNYQKTVS